MSFWVIPPFHESGLDGKTKLFEVGGVGFWSILPEISKNVLILPLEMLDIVLIMLTQMLSYYTILNTQN